MASCQSPTTPHRDKAPLPPWPSPFHDVQPAAEDGCCVLLCLESQPDTGERGGEPSPDANSRGKQNDQQPHPQQPLGVPEPPVSDPSVQLQAVKRSCLLVLSMLMLLVAAWCSEWWWWWCFGGTNDVVGRHCCNVSNSFSQQGGFSYQYMLYVFFFVGHPRPGFKLASSNPKTPQCCSSERNAGPILWQHAAGPSLIGPSDAPHSPSGRW